MALPTSGPLSFSQIIAEFGSDGTPSLSEYYRGGPRVPDTVQNAGIGTAGQELRLSQFYGASASIPPPPNTITKDGDASAYVEGDSETGPAFQLMITNDVVLSGNGLTSATWAQVSGDTFTVTIEDANGLHVHFSANCGKGATLTAIYRATGNHGLSVDVDIEVQYAAF